MNEAHVVCIRIPSFFLFFLWINTIHQVFDGTSMCDASCMTQHNIIKRNKISAKLNRRYLYIHISFDFIKGIALNHFTRFVN